MVKVNRKDMEWKEGMVITDAIRFAKHPEYNDPILVVTLNDVHIKYEQFKTTLINKGDIIDILQPLDGG